MWVLTLLTSFVCTALIYFSDTPVRDILHEKKPIFPIKFIKGNLDFPEAVFWTPYDFTHVKGELADLNLDGCFIEETKLCEVLKKSFQYEKKYKNIIAYKQTKDKFKFSRR